MGFVPPENISIGGLAFTYHAEPQHGTWPLAAITLSLELLSRLRLGGGSGMD